MKTKKTKILAIGDIHGDRNMAERLAEKAKKENVDLVVLAGDLTFGEMSTEGIIGPFTKEGKRVLIIPGNHESLATVNFLSEAYPDTKNIHGYYFVHNGIGFFGAGLGNLGIHQINESDLFELLKRSHETLKKKQGVEKTFMVSHIQPANSLIERIGGFPGSQSVTKAIYYFQPDIAVCGHLHESGGVEEKLGKTHVVNVARKEKIFEI
ncbi:MAG: metallophosphoesterase [Candidatus Nanoarchaeia archaeon]